MKRISLITLTALSLILAGCDKTVRTEKVGERDYTSSDSCVLYTYVTYYSTGKIMMPYTNYVWGQRRVAVHATEFLDHKQSGKVQRRVETNITAYLSPCE